MQNFIDSLHKSSKLLSTGTVTVLETEFPAVFVRNLYGQETIWGYFGVEWNKKTGEFKKWTGRLANDSNTAGVIYVSH